MKRFNTKVIIALAFVSLSAGAAKMYAQTWNIGSPSAADLTATISGTSPNYTLTIDGTGAMQDFTSPPWYSMRSNIKTLVINPGVTSIGNAAFYDCYGLTGVLSIPNSITSIGTSAFYHCYGFTAINVDENNLNFSSDNGILFNKDKTELIQCPAGKTGTLTIPNSVKTIGDYAFYACGGFTGALTIPSGVNSIGDYAFYASGFTGALTIPNSVTTIGEGAFDSCAGFTGTLTIGDSVKTIGNRAFYDCYFTGSLTIPNSVTTIGDYAFYASGFTGALTIPNSVTTIGEGAFDSCSGFTGALTIPNSVKTIGDYAFYNCIGFTGALTIGDSVTTIGDHAFDYCGGFTGVTIGNAVTSIGDYVFINCAGFTGTLTIPNSVKTIGNHAFDGCIGFTGTLTIGDSVTTIGSVAFHDCIGFTSITCRKPAPPVPAIGANTFNGISHSIPVYVVCGMQSYFESSNWNYFSNFQAILPVITVQSNDEAMGSASVVQMNTCENNEAIIAATANDGYHFVSWDDSNTDNPRTIEVASDITFMAIFEHTDGTDNIFANQLNIYPNPAKDIITVASSELQNETYTVFSISGQALMQGKLQGETTTINVSSLASGVYFVKVSDKTAKFIKNKALLF